MNEFEDREKIIELMEDAIIEKLMNDFEFDCMNETEFGDIIPCPFYEYDKDYVCKGNCNNEKYFEIFINLYKEKILLNFPNYY